ncbi:hypothetical protein MMC25_000144 [Agyrium rufum]|nr:hypothetical protein [Agyrium rufum]
MASAEPSNQVDLETALGRRFTTLTTSLGASSSVASEWADIFIKRYTEPQRHYHTLDHIGAMVHCLEEYRELIHDEEAVRLAIFFHDIIYDPRRNDNEVASVKLFEEYAASIRLAEPMIGKVKGFIEQTITHTLPHGEKGEGDEDLALFLDFDLEVLSRSREEYGKYATQIRSEYNYYKDDEYRRGRAKVLRGFLERDSLYFSQKFRDKNEGAARRNLRMEVSELEG